MRFTATRVDDRDLAAFVRRIAPLGTDVFAAARDDDARREILRDAIAGLALDPAREPGKALTAACGDSGRSLLLAVHMVTFWWVRTFIHQHRKGEALIFSGPHFGFHAEVARALTGSSSIITRGGEARVAEFRGTHVERYSWLTAEECAGLRFAPQAPLTKNAVEGTLPEWSPEKRRRYAEKCLNECAALQRFVEGSPGLAYVACVDNGDWEFE